MLLMSGKLIVTSVSQSLFNIPTKDFHSLLRKETRWVSFDSISLNVEPKVHQVLGHGHWITHYANHQKELTNRTTYDDLFLPVEYK